MPRADLHGLDQAPGTSRPGASRAGPGRREEESLADRWSMTSGDTIAAISSSVGASARIVVRTSGPHSFFIAGELGAGDKRSSASQRQLDFANLHCPSWIYNF